MAEENPILPVRPTLGWKEAHCENYINSGGAKGHIMDLSAMGGHKFTTHCLIRHKGRKTGKTLINPLVYGDIGGEIVLVASKAGDPMNPGWYYNITASETIDVQIATTAFRAKWREAEGDERERLWDFMVQILPAYASYQQRAERRIPVIVLTLLEEIPVFTALTEA
jgi:deazaflavin-dependent oxidoreductase (nitroreductase family)